MSKVLVVGAAPLPFENTSTLYSLGIRTWHLVKPLLSKGHQVCLVALRLPAANWVNINLPPLTENTGKFNNLIYYCINQLENFNFQEFLSLLFKEFAPDCIIGVNTFPASIAAKLVESYAVKSPFWVDLHGALMMEAQTRAHLINDDNILLEYWEQEEVCLRNADVFSTVTERQKMALIGELAAVGRLNRYTFGYEFVYTIPSSIEETEEIITKNKQSVKKKILREKFVSEDDFVILWSGGYNAWTDIKTLFTALQQVMETNPKIKFVSTGGPILKHDEQTYPRFLELINTSKYRNQFVMLGWVPTEDVELYYYESDLGINIDSYHYETLLGTRTRLIHMMKVGLPVLTSLGTELSQIIHDNNLGLTFSIGKSEELKEKIEYAFTHREELRRLGERAQQYVLTHFNCEKTTQKLQEWVNQPWHAPDKRIKIDAVKLFLSRSKNRQRSDSILLDNLQSKKISQEISINQQAPIKYLYNFFKKLFQKNKRKSI